MKDATNEHGNMARAAIVRAAEDQRRRTDPVERAKAFIARRVPCYAAEVAGGPTGHFVVGTRIVTREELFAIAREKGWVE